MINAYFGLFLLLEYISLFLNLLMYSTNNEISLSNFLKFLYQWVFDKKQKNPLLVTNVLYVYFKNNLFFSFR